MTKPPSHDDVISAIFVNVSRHMSGGKCPTPGCLGECAIIAPIGEAQDGSDRDVYFGACYIWDTQFNDSTLLASWFQEAGAKGVTVSHVLFDEDNGDRDGKAGDMDDARAWHVHFVLERASDRPLAPPVETAVEALAKRLSLSDVIEAIEPFAAVGLDVLQHRPGWANWAFRSKWADHYTITYPQFQKIAAVAIALKQETMPASRSCADNATLPQPDGVENLKAILADQPYQNSALSVFEISLILANEGGFMPDEAVLWFREHRGKFVSTAKVIRTEPQEVKEPEKVFELTPFMVKLLKRAWSNGRITLADDMAFRHAEMAAMREMAEHGFVRSAEEDRLMPGPPQPPGWVITDKGREAASSAPSRTAAPSQNE